MTEVVIRERHLTYAAYRYRLDAIPSRSQAGEQRELQRRSADSLAPQDRIFQFEMAQLRVVCLHEELKLIAV